VFTRSGSRDRTSEDSPDEGQSAKGSKELHGSVVYMRVGLVMSLEDDGLTRGVRN
jgi:hypothetical protein